MFRRRYSIPELSVAEAIQYLHKEYVLWLDVRAVYEHNQANIPGSALISLGLLSARENELHAARDNQIIVYCATGSRSYHAVKWLIDWGYKAKNLKGGIMMWRMLNQPIQPKGSL
ncbi:MAG: rhodanese-like domain-containing protein [Fidelibacterota bacterium]